LFATRTLLALRGRFDGFGDSEYRPLPMGPELCAFTRGAPDVAVVVPVRPARSFIRPAELADDEWRDVLAPLDAIYGNRRPAVFVRG
jgi:hypothetical protein